MGLNMEAKTCTKMHFKLFEKKMVSLKVEWRLGWRILIPKILHGTYWISDLKKNPRQFFAEYIWDASFNVLLRFSMFGFDLNDDMDEDGRFYLKRSNAYNIKKN